MQQIIEVILVSGRTALDLALYILLPVMVIMLAFMKLLEARGVLGWVSRKLSPLSGLFGVPGIGLFAMLKLLFVSFAAPMASISIMQNQAQASRYLASTLAMIFCMSQANASFPLAAMGLNLGTVLLSSLVGGLLAAAFTYYVLCRHMNCEAAGDLPLPDSGADRKSALQVMNDGGQEGVRIVIGMLPMLILALFLVNVLKQTGLIDWISLLLAPMLGLLGLPEATVLPIVTKFIAGGTAFMGVTVDLMNQGLISAVDLNRMAGFVTNPLDLLGVSVYASLGEQVREVLRFAVLGAAFGMLLRGVFHLLWF